MKKILSLLFCLCLLIGAAAAEEAPGENDILLRIWNRSEMAFSYLHFDFYTGDFLAGTSASTPNEEEDFYRAPFSAEKPEDLQNLRITCAGGVSELDPEEALIEFMMGRPAEEHAVEMPELSFEGGKVYDLELVSDGEGGLRLEPLQAE